MTPDQLAKPGTEDAIQSAYFCALVPYIRQHPDLRWIHAIPNGGDRNMAVASTLKATGVRSGVWDVHVPVPKNTSPGMWLEFKRPKYRSTKNGGLSDNQLAFGWAMNSLGYHMRVCYGWEEALIETLQYLRINRDR